VIEVVGRLGAIAALAILAGIALSLRDLVLPPPRQVPLPLEGLVIVSWLFALAMVGWLTAQVIDGPLRLVVAPGAVVLAFAVAFLCKVLRYPDAPLVGDGFEVLIWIYAAVGLVGAALGSLSALRMKSQEGAGRVSAGLVILAGMLGALPYVLAR
jgi:hypothetical protein